MPKSNVLAVGQPEEKHSKEQVCESLATLIKAYSFEPDNHICFIELGELKAVYKLLTNPDDKQSS